jgi:hypothetical protein
VDFLLGEISLIYAHTVCIREIISHFIQCRAHHFRESLVEVNCSSKNRKKNFHSIQGENPSLIRKNFSEKIIFFISYLCVKGSSEYVGS